jgi:hypothetical protein
MIEVPWFKRDVLFRSVSFTEAVAAAGFIEKKLTRQDCDNYFIVFQLNFLRSKYSFNYGAVGYGE